DARLCVRARRAPRRGRSTAVTTCRKRPRTSYSKGSYATSRGVRDLVDLIEALVIGSTEKWVQIGAKCYRAGGADMGVERAHVPEDLDKLKMIGCPFLGDQGEGLHSAIIATVYYEIHQQRFRYGHVLRIHIDMRNDNDFPKPVVKPVSMGGCPHQARRHSQWQYPVELTHQTFLPHAWIPWVRFWSGTRQCHQRRRPAYSIRVPSRTSNGASSSAVIRA